ncbi:MAG TPA: hypothetical protein VJH23_06475 [archaeon]|nr:hypothetical protein [archaeon]
MLGQKQETNKIVWDETKKELLAKSEISLILDTYDDIFSDFDPRPYSVRTLSEDFLVAAKKAMPAAREGQLGMSFLIPKAMRNTAHEVLIKKKLREYFRKHGSVMEQERTKIRGQGIAMTVVGLAILLLATFIISIERHDLLFNFLIVVLEPSGWFTVWSGMEAIAFKSKERDVEIDFYARMAKAEINFTAY